MVWTRSIMGFRKQFRDSDNPLNNTQGHCNAITANGANQLAGFNINVGAVTH
jgi:hypothetical protein